MRGSKIWPTTFQSCLFQHIYPLWIQLYCMQFFASYCQFYWSIVASPNFGTDKMINPWWKGGVSWMSKLCGRKSNNVWKGSLCTHLSWCPCIGWTERKAIFSLVTHIGGHIVSIGHPFVKCLCKTLNFVLLRCSHCLDAWNSVDALSPFQFEKNWNGECEIKSCSYSAIDFAPSTERI